MLLDVLKQFDRYVLSILVSIWLPLDASSIIVNLSPDLIIVPSGNMFILDTKVSKIPLDSAPNELGVSTLCAPWISLLLILRSGDGNEPIWPLLVRGLYDATYIIPPYSLIPTGT